MQSIKTFFWLEKSMEFQNIMSIPAGVATRENKNTACSDLDYSETFLPRRN